MLTASCGNRTCPVDDPELEDADPKWSANSGVPTEASRESGSDKLGSGEAGRPLTSVNRACVRLVR
jgi:hypothetical protein